MIYDNGNARVSGLNAELDVKISDDLDIFGRAEFRDYKMASDAEPWNLPKFKLIAGTAININDKVKLTGSLLIRGSVYDRTTVTTLTVPATPPALSVVNIGSFADLSGGVEYKVNNRVSIFAKVNNILNTTNQSWLYYPDYGFNIFGGVGFAF